MNFLSPQNYDDFLKLASEGTVVPVSKRVMADLLTPVAAYMKIERLSPYSFLLESVEGGEKVARYSFLGFDPHAIVRCRDAKVAIESASGKVETAESMLAVLRRLAGKHIPVRLPDMPPFVCGAVGYMSYDAVRWFEDVPDENADDLDVDDAVMMFFSRLLVFDHVRHQIHLIANIFTEGKTDGMEEDYRAALEDIESMEALLDDPAEPLPRRSAKGRAPLRSNVSREDFESGVVRAKEFIAAGDIFQVVLSQRFEVGLSAHPFEVYRSLRVVNPSPYMFYLKMGDQSIIGASPEMLVRATGRRLEYRPIAGTRPRGATETEDLILGEELRADEKEVAEHVMLVDLGRNDLGRVADFGSVEVTELMMIERYSHVMHLVSGIKARLRPGMDRFDALAACFPAGTVTGAPKVRAMEIIDELEPARRGVYAGSVMYLDYSGNLDSCISIRTILVKDGKAYIQAGAGIVADSVPETEYVETVNKARAMLQAIDMAEKR
ncbi:MAG TPA: anthranilate synthase component I [Blastocatellia bacterium]|jgi:anthranilate synthase component 1|nr:anthranilate synthase component I [Blastocatellia bacterium]